MADETQPDVQPEVEPGERSGPINPITGDFYEAEDARAKAEEEAAKEDKAAKRKK